MHHITVKRFAVFLTLLLIANIILFAYIAAPK
jgi:hypothetical protein